MNDVVRGAMMDGAKKSEPNDRHKKEKVMAQHEEFIPAAVKPNIAIDIRVGEIASI